MNSNSLANLFDLPAVRRHRLLPAEIIRPDADLDDLSPRARRSPPGAPRDRSGPGGRARSFAHRLSAPAARFFALPRTYDENR